MFGFHATAVSTTVSLFSRTYCILIVHSLGYTLIPRACMVCIPYYLGGSLDNVCAEPNPSDSRYLSALHKEHERHEDFPRTKPQDMVRGCMHTPYV